MEFVLGFVIAVFIALTGVGAGSLTTPLLILFFGLPAKEAVGSALIFGTVVKILSVPGYLMRKQVNWRVFGYLTAAGLPGVILGAFLLSKVPGGWVTGLVGLMIMSMALINLFRFAHVARHDRAKWLAPIGGLIGLEMGFSSAGAGAIGALAMMSLTTLSTAEIVGTDLSFGLALSAVGGLIHAGLGDVNTAILWKILTGGVLGAFAGSALATRVPSRKLRFVLCLALVYIGGQLSWKSFNDMHMVSSALLPVAVVVLVAGGAWALSNYLRSAQRSALPENVPQTSSRAAGK